MRDAPRNPLSPDVYAKLTGFEGAWRDNWWRRDFLELCLARRGPETPLRTLLDVGCGAGHWGRTLAAALPGEAAVCGVDIEDDFVDRAVRAAAAAGLEAEYRKAEAEAVPYEDDRFDLVTCQTLLIHVRRPEAVLAEMRRVLRPGGLMLLAEPNNIVGYLSYLMSEPRPEWTVVRRLLDFYHTCLEGKIACGMGDSSIGDKLPAMLARTGMRDIEVALNENCPALVPPYPGERQRIEREFVRDHIAGASWWMGFGPAENARRYFRAGGGREEEFEPLWSEVMAFQRGVAGDLDAGRYGGGRGPMMYLVSATK